MNSEDLALLLGVLGGGFAGHFGAKRRHDRERAERKEDRQERLDFARQMRDEDREYKKTIEAEEKAEAEKLDAESLTLGDFFVDPFTKGIKYETLGDIGDQINPFTQNPDTNMYIPLPGNPFDDPRQEGKGWQDLWGLDLWPGDQSQYLPGGLGNFNQGGRIEYNQGGIVDLYKRLNRG